MDEKWEMKHDVRIAVGGADLEGIVSLPTSPIGLVLFAHGSGSSRHSPRNLLVSNQLQDAGIATVLFDLLTRDEEEIDRYTLEFRFDIGLLSQRLIKATHWVASHPQFHDLPLGYFGASTGSAAALIAASELRDNVRAVVVRKYSRCANVISIPWRLGNVRR